MWSAAILLIGVSALTTGFRVGDELRQLVSGASECVRKILECAPNYSPIANNEISGYLFEHPYELERACESNVEYVGCVERAAIFCGRQPSMSEVEVEMIDNRLWIRDLCSPNSRWKKVYAKYSSCITGEALMATRTCHLPSGPRFTGMHNVCGYLEGTVACIEDILRRKCGPYAADLFRKTSLMKGGREYFCQNKKKRSTSSTKKEESTPYKQSSTRHDSSTQYKQSSMNHEESTQYKLPFSTRHEESPQYKQSSTKHDDSTQSYTKQEESTPYKQSSTNHREESSTRYQPSSTRYQESTHSSTRHEESNREQLRTARQMLKNVRLLMKNLSSLVRSSMTHEEAEFILKELSHEEARRIKERVTRREPLFEIEDLVKEENVGEFPSRVVEFRTVREVPTDIRRKPEEYGFTRESLGQLTPVEELEVKEEHEEYKNEENVGEEYPEDFHRQMDPSVEGYGYPGEPLKQLKPVEEKVGEFRTVHEVKKYPEDIHQEPGQLDSSVEGYGFPEESLGRLKPVEVQEEQSPPEEYENSDNSQNMYEEYSQFREMNFPLADEEYSEVSQNTDHEVKEYPIDKPVEELEVPEEHVEYENSDNSHNVYEEYPHFSEMNSPLAIEEYSEDIHREPEEYGFPQEYVGPSKPVKELKVPEEQTPHEEYENSDNSQNVFEEYPHFSKINSPLAVEEYSEVSQDSDEPIQPAEELVEIPEEQSTHEEYESSDSSQNVYEEYTQFSETNSPLAVEEYSEVSQVYDEPISVNTSGETEYPNEWNNGQRTSDEYSEGQLSSIYEDEELKVPEEQIATHEEYEYLKESHDAGGETELVRVADEIYLDRLQERESRDIGQVNVHKDNGKNIKSNKYVVEKIEKPEDSQSGQLSSSLGAYDYSEQFLSSDGQLSSIYDVDEIKDPEKYHYDQLYVDFRKADYQNESQVVEPEESRDIYPKLEYADGQLNPLFRIDKIEYSNEYQEVDSDHPEKSLVLDMELNRLDEAEEIGYPDLNRIQDNEDIYTSNESQDVNMQLAKNIDYPDIGQLNRVQDNEDIDPSNESEDVDMQLTEDIEYTDYIQEPDMKRQLESVNEAVESDYPEEWENVDEDINHVPESKEILYPNESIHQSNSEYEKETFLSAQGEENEYTEASQVTEEIAISGELRDIDFISDYSLDVSTEQNCQSLKDLDTEEDYYAEKEIPENKIYHNVENEKNCKPIEDSVAEQIYQQSEENYKTSEDLLNERDFLPSLKSKIHDYIHDQHADEEPGIESSPDKLSRLIESDCEIGNSGSLDLLSDLSAKDSFEKRSLELHQENEMKEFHSNFNMVTPGNRQFPLCKNVHSEEFVMEDTSAEFCDSSSSFNCPIVEGSEPTRDVPIEGSMKSNCPQIPDKNVVEDSDIEHCPNVEQVELPTTFSVEKEYRDTSGDILETIPDIRPGVYIDMRNIETIDPLKGFDLVYPLKDNVNYIIVGHPYYPTENTLEEDGHTYYPTENTLEEDWTEDSVYFVTPGTVTVPSAVDYSDIEELVAEGIDAIQAEKTFEESF